METDIKDLLIIGTGGLALEVVDLIDSINRRNKIYNIIGFYDDYQQGLFLNRYPIIGKIESITRIKNQSIVIALSNPFLRKRIQLFLNKTCETPSFPNLIHPTAQISNHVNIESNSGIIINAYAIVSALAKIEPFSIIEHASFVGHETHLGSFSTIYAHSTIAGKVKIGELVQIGLGSSIIQELFIGERTFIGAGSTVVTNIEPGVIAVGTPCKSVKKLEPKEL